MSANALPSKPKLYSELTDDRTPKSERATPMFTPGVTPYTSMPDMSVSRSSFENDLASDSYNKLLPSKADSSESEIASPPRRKGILGYPMGIFFMLGNEFCERFSYYGMRAILTLYLRSVHNYDESTSKVIFHAFIFVCFFTPLLGALMADGWFGRFRVILYGSVVYVIGHILLTLGSIPNLAAWAVKVLDFTGLVTIAIATGGIKPCVSSFAADQFPASMADERRRFFSFFYFAINAGALISKFVTPILRGRVQCLGKDTCFPLAFGVPAGLMFIALVLFVAGKAFYVIKPRSAENVVSNVLKCSSYAVKKKVQGGGPPSKESSHWLDLARDKFDYQLVEDIKGLLHISVLFIPVAIFWALFDQQGSTWVIQANKMDGRVGQVTILPDQMSVFNPLLVIILIPVFEGALFPLLNKCKILTTPLQRMSFGGLLAALSFALAALLQFQVDQTSMVPISQNQFRAFVINRSPCSMNFTNDVINVSIPPYTNDVSFDVARGEYRLRSSDCVMGNGSSSYSASVSPSSNSLILAITSDDNRTMRVSSMERYLAKAENGKNVIHFLALFDTSDEEIQVKQNTHRHTYNFDAASSAVTIDLQSPIVSVSHYDVTVTSASRQGNVLAIPVEMGRVDAVVVTQSLESIRINLVPPNGVALMWQFPQYVAISSGEIFMSVTGMEFAYSQAPASMKSVVSALWLLTISLGSVINMIIFGSKLFDEAAVEFAVYACLMFVVTLIFIYLSTRYTYVDQDEIVAEREKDASKHKEMYTFSTSPTVEAQELMQNEDVTIRT